MLPGFAVAWTMVESMLGCLLAMCNKCLKAKDLLELLLECNFLAERAASKPSTYLQAILEQNSALLQCYALSEERLVLV